MGLCVTAKALCSFLCVDPTHLGGSCLQVGMATAQGEVSRFGACTPARADDRRGSWLASGMIKRSLQRTSGAALCILW